MGLTPKKWDAILQQMIDGFKRAQKRDAIIDRKMNKGIPFKKAFKEEEKSFRDTMNLFAKWFFDLWD
jgi:hypothetical protein